MEKDLTGDRKFTVNVSSPGQCKRVLAIEIPEEELERERETIVQELRRELRVPGFRKGKVPVEYVRKNYADVIRGDAVRNLLPVIYDQAVRREGLRPLGDPGFENLENEPGAGLKAEIHVEVRPDVVATGYDSLRIDATRRPVGKEQVEETVERLRERFVAYEPVDRHVGATDLVTVDYAPYDGSGKIDESARQKSYPIEMESTHLLEQFRTGLMGMKAGQDRDIEVRYAEDFPDKEVAGSERSFHVRVVEVKEKLVPEPDDAFAKRVDEKFESIEALREQVRTDLETEEEKRYTHEIQEKAVDRLIEGNSFDVPEIMINNYLTSVIEEDRRRRPEVEDEAVREKEVRELFHDAAVRSIRKFFILEAIQNQERIELTEEDIAARIKKLSEATGRPPEEIEKYLEQPDHRRSFENELLDEKVMGFLRERMKVHAG
ncbi:MAG: trigger factor [Candidatus Krumholzibacteriota bacterium]|nr:trigger factor [Candidatus Krumholzibacteriota bacterium]